MPFVPGRAEELVLESSDRVWGWRRDWIQDLV